MWGKRSNTFRYALYGALFGLAFPVLSSLGDLYLQQLPLTLGGLLQVQRTTPLHWVIDTAPLFLGLFASLAGRRHDQLVRLNESLRQWVQERDQAISQLEIMRAGLEQQVTQRTADLARRTSRLEAATQVAQAAATSQNSEVLLTQTAHLISERFSFYHTGIFLLDDAGEYMVLRAASSEGGQRMLARRYKLRVSEEGIVGNVARTGEPRIALNVGADAVFFNNPDLSLTHSELALPLKVRGQIIGALDVQSTEPAAFSNEDVVVLQALADQLALIIDNARLLEQSQRALQDLDALYGRRLQRVWQGRTARQPAAFRYTGLGVEPASPAAAPEVADFYSRSDLVQEGDSHQVAAAIRLRGQSIGAIVLQQDSEEQPWSPEEMSLVEEVSAQIGLALENARLLEETQARAEEMAVLNGLSWALASHLSVREVLDEVYKGASRLLDATNFYVALYDPDRDEVTFPLDVTQEEGDKFYTLPADQGLTGYIIRNRTSLLIKENLPQRLAEMGIELVGAPALSWLGAPLMVGDRVLGMIGVQSYTTPRAYDEHDRDLLTALASQMAIALQNAYQFEQSQARARQERVIREVTTRMRETLDMDTVLKTAAQEMRQALGLSKIAIRLATHEPDNGTVNKTTSSQN